MKRFLLTMATGLLSMLILSPAVFADNASLTSSGIGNVKTGTLISKLPKKMAGVYDKLEFVESEEEESFEESVPVYRATLGGEVVFEFDPDGEKVGSITVFSKNLKTSDGLSLNSTVSDLFAAGGQVITLMEGGEAIFCDGILFTGLPMTPAGYQKSERSYLGDEVTFDASDFDPAGHPSGILIPAVMDSDPVAMPAGGQSSGTKTRNIILGILFIVAVLAMIAHMVYVNYFTKPYPEEIEFGYAAPEDNDYVKNALESLYYHEFSPLCEPGETPGPETVRYPVGKKAAYHAKEVLDDIYANHLPVDGEAESLLNRVAVVTNDAFKRSFAGSKAFLVVAVIIAAIACFLNKDATPLIYFGLSCILYWFASRTPNYILVEKDLKAAKTGKESKNFMTGAIAGILGLAATAPVYVKVTKDRNTGEVLDREEDHSMTWIAMAFSVVLFIVIAYLMLFVGIFNYLRNYVFRK